MQHDPARLQDAMAIPKDVRQRLERRLVQQNAGRNDIEVIVVKIGEFREDLYYRLKVVELHVPPLRDRRDDILPLARLLLAHSATRMDRKISGLTPDAADQLLRYEWPGNVRELENAMERAVALARGNRVQLTDLPGEIRQAFPMPVIAEESVIAPPVRWSASGHAIFENWNDGLSVQPFDPAGKERCE